MMTQPASRSTRLLVVEDEPDFRASLCRTLQEAGYQTLEAGDGKIALDILDKHTVSLVLLDLRLPRVSGMDVLRNIADRYPWLPVIILSAYGTVPTAAEAIRLGAVEFLEKDHDETHTLAMIGQVLERTPVPAASTRSAEDTWSRYAMLGSSPAISRAYDLIDRIAPTDAVVLLEGESGTGKSHVAGAIHRNSRRAERRLIVVNCAAIPSELVEGELFGHVRGAFTGAHHHRIGLIESADGGTLMLNEIGDMALLAQSKLLQALDERRIRRVGGSTDVAVDFRLIAATNKDLADEVSEGRFREDLYFRLNVIRIVIPPLRERREDVPMLASHFLKETLARHGLADRTLQPAALRVLQDHDWPGNVRELRNVIERIALLADGAEIDARQARAGVQRGMNHDEQPTQLDLRQARDAFDRMFIERTLQDNDYRIQQSADALGINRTTLWKNVRRLGIRMPDRH